MATSLLVIGASAAAQGGLSRYGFEDPSTWRDGIPRPIQSVRARVEPLWLDGDTIHITPIQVLEQSDEPGLDDLIVQVGKRYSTRLNGFDAPERKGKRNSGGHRVTPGSSPLNLALALGAPQHHGHDLFGIQNISHGFNPDPFGVQWDLLNLDPRARTFGDDVAASHETDLGDRNTQQDGHESTLFARRLLDGQEEVILDVSGRDKYDRVLSLCHYKGSDGKMHCLNLEMVLAGWGWWYRKHVPLATAFEQAEKIARARRVGIWQNDNPEPPWDFRQRQRQAA